MRRNAKTDANHTAIADAFRAYGCSVEHTHMLAGGFPDLICAMQLRTWLVEVKDGRKRPSERALTEEQKLFHEGWRGMIFVVERVGDVGNVVNQVLTRTVVVPLTKPYVPRNLQDRANKK